MTEVASADLIEFLRRQRQSRQFTDEPVTEADLEQILQVARWTGSSKNTQPWEFVVVTEPALKAEIGAATQWTSWAADAPVVIVIVTATSAVTAVTPISTAIAAIATSVPAGATTMAGGFRLRPSGSA